MDRQADRRSDRWMGRHTEDKQKNRHTFGKPDGQTDGWAGIERTDGQMDSQTGRKTERWTDRQTDIFGTFLIEKVTY